MNDFVDGFEKLTDKQQEGLGLLLMGYTNKEVAKKLGVDPNTVYRWRVSADFKNTLNEMKIRNIGELENKIHVLGDKAVTKLEKLLLNAENENNQIKSIMFILTKLTDYSQLDMIQRLDNIEKWINENEKF